MQKIILEPEELKKQKKEREGEISMLKIVLGINQTIKLKDHVLENWCIDEELEGICTVHSDFHYAKKRNDMMGGYATYRVERNAAGAPILCRRPW